MATTLDSEAGQAGLPPHPPAVGGSRLMSWTIEREGHVVRLSLEGEFDMAAVADFAAMLRDIESTRPRAIVLDLDGLGFMDSTGLESLLAAHRRAAGSHLFGVLRGTGPAHRLITLVGLDGHFVMIDALSAIPKRLTH